MEIDIYFDGQLIYASLTLTHKGNCKIASGTHQKYIWIIYREILFIFTKCKPLVNVIQLNEKLPLPYYFDIVHYESLKHDGLKEHIDTYGCNKSSFWCQAPKT